MSIKLFAINSFSLQFFDFVSSLKQTVNRNWVHFTFSRSKQFKSTFFWIYKPELSQFCAFAPEHLFLTFSEWLLYYWCFKYITSITVIYSRIFSGSWIGCAWSKQENTIRRSKPVSTVFLLHRISEEFFGPESGVTNARHNWPNLY